jgi:type VI protein secretion system component Hcp
MPAIAAPKPIDHSAANPGATDNGVCELTLADLDTVVGGVDAASPKLYQACCKGTHIPEVVIE